MRLIFHLPELAQLAFSLCCQLESVWTAAICTTVCLLLLCCWWLASSVLLYLIFLRIVDLLHHLLMSFISLPWWNLSLLLPGILKTGEWLTNWLRAVFFLRDDSVTLIAGSIVCRCVSIFSEESENVGHQSFDIISISVCCHLQRWFAGDLLGLKMDTNQHSKWAPPVSDHSRCLCVITLDHCICTNVFAPSLCMLSSGLVFHHHWCCCCCCFSSHFGIAEQLLLAGVTLDFPVSRSVGH